jgi:hypothetical protein
MSRPSAAAPALSIVIPAPADAAALEATLVSVLENRPPACEVVVPLGFAYDDRWGIADEVRLVTAPPDSGVAACANVGIAASAAPLVHVLAAGWLATPGWTEQPLDILADRRVQAVVPVGVTGDAAATIASTGVRLTRGGRRVAVVPSRRALRAGRLDAARVRAAAPVLEAGFWRAGAIAAIGPGFATCCGDWLADADMAAALACLPGRVVVAPESRVVCGAGRDRPRPFTAGLQAERLFWRSLARGGLATSLVGHVIEIVRDAVASAPLGTLPMLLGRTVALMQCGDFVARFARLRALRRTPAAASEGTLRIDAAHASPARPRLRTDDAPPLKRSA